MVQVLWLLIAAAGLALLVVFSGWIQYMVGGLLLASGALWILISVLSPARPDRKCPKCRKEGLVKIRRGESGVRCEICGFMDGSLHVAYLDDW